MKLLKKFYSKIDKYIPIFILGIALFLRLFDLPHRTFFNADQEWLMFRSRDLLKGDLALIGPTTSVGAFSIGPGYIYLSAIFSFIFGGDPVSGAYLSVLLGILTLFAIYLFCKYFISEGFGRLMLLLVSFSSFFISWDQNPWAPSLFLLSQMLVLTGSYLISQKKELGWIFLVSGGVLGFQSHMGIILSLVSSLVYLILIRAKLPTRRYFLLSTLILLIGILPNLVFDLANDFVNAKRLSGIFSGGEYSYLGFSKVTGAMAYFSSSILYPRQINIIDSLIIRVILAASIANGLSFLFDKKMKNMALLLLITSILPPALFYLQQGKFSEYYIMMSIPSLLILSGLLLYKLKDNKLIFYTVIVVSLFLNLNSWKNTYQKLSLYDKKQVVSKIVKMGGVEGYGVSLSTDLGQNFGYSYIFDYYKARPNTPPLKNQKKIFTIVVPNGYEGINGFEDYGGIGLLWQGL